MNQSKFFSLLKENFSPLDFSMWLKELDFSPKSNHNGVLHLRCFSPTKKEKIERDFLPDLTNLAHQCDKSINRVCIDFEKGEHAPVSEISKKSQTSEFLAFRQAKKNHKDFYASSQDFIQTGEVTQTADVSQSSLVQNNQRSSTTPSASVFHQQGQHFSFDNFVKTKENALALSFAKKVVSQFSRYSPLYFFGSVGVGKTHLLNAVKNEFSKVIPANRMRFITPDRFVGEFSAALRARRDAEFRARYRALDLLLIDDVQCFMGKEKTSIEFFHLFNAIYCPGKQMLFASDRSPSELGGIDARLKSRLSSSAIVELRPPSYQSRKDILAFYAQSHHLPKDEEIFDYIAKNIGGDVRKILGIVRTLAAIRDVEKREISIEDCHRVLSALSLHDRFVVRAKDVLLAVEKYYDLRPVHWQAKRKDRLFKEAFHGAAYLLKKHCHLSVNQIAELIFCKPYSVVYSVKTMEKKIVSDQKLAMTIAEIEKSFIEQN